MQNEGQNIYYKGQFSILICKLSKNFDIINYFLGKNWEIEKSLRLSSFEYKNFMFELCGMLNQDSLGESINNDGEFTVNLLRNDTFITDSESDFLFEENDELNNLYRLFMLDPREHEYYFRAFDNINYLFFLKKGQPGFDRDCLERILRFREMIEGKGLEAKDFLIDSSTVLALFGIRKVGDLDYLTILPETAQLPQADDIENHFFSIPFYEECLHSSVFDENNSFPFWGLKILSLDALRRFKTYRNEYPKDFRDIHKIDKILGKDYSLSLKKWFIFFHNNFFLFRKKIRLFLEARGIYWISGMWEKIKKRKI